MWHLTEYYVTIWWYITHHTLCQHRWEQAGYWQNIYILQGRSALRCITRSAQETGDRRARERVRERGRWNVCSMWIHLLDRLFLRVWDQFLSVGAVRGRTNKVKFCLTCLTKYVEKGQTDQTTKMLIFWVYLHPLLLFKLTGILGFLISHKERKDSKHVRKKFILFSCVSVCSAFCCAVLYLGAESFYRVICILQSS